MLLNVTRTAYPDGEVKHHPFGMEKPKVDCLAKVMKQGIINYLESKKQLIEQAQKLAMP
ncbi:MAG: hypothetical protein K0S09_56 [Sphingobacteriaceae bacterium]|jgi:hypothetical protein|nr:hypothetical protein [Sphingobacteriaceae bacterium]